MSQITAIVIWKQGHYTGACLTPTSLNADRFTEGPKAAWLSSTSYCCGGDEALKLELSNPNDINALSGVFVAEDGIGYFLDGTVADAVAKANGCCGTNAAVTPIYNGVYPSVVLPTATVYTVTRTDNGGLMDSDRFMVDYMKWIIDGTYLKTGYSNGVSTYSFQSYSDPIPQGGDTIVETPRVFTSNTAPALTGSNVFTVNYRTDTVAASFKGATTLAATVTALNADATASSQGTWSVSGSTILLTSTVTDSGSVVLAQQAP